MVRNVGIHRVDDCNIVNVTCGVFENLANVSSVFAILFELVRRSHGDAGFALCFQFERKRLAISFLQFGFVVKGVDLRGPTIHEQVNDAFGFSGKVCGARDKWICVLLIIEV